MTKKRRQIEGRIAQRWPHATLIQARNRGERVWAISCAKHEVGAHAYTLTDGTCCADYARTLDDLHDILFRDAGINPENYWR
jgi:hypothetical protein